MRVDAEARRPVFDHLRETGIGANVHYIPVHLQPYWQHHGFRPGDYPVAEDYYARAISIPLYATMTDTQQDDVVGRLSEALLQA